MVAMRIYSKSVFLSARSLTILKLDMAPLGTHFYRHDDDGMTVTYFTARSGLVGYAFKRGKCICIIHQIKLAIISISDQDFLLSSKFCTRWSFLPCPALPRPGAIYMYMLKRIMVEYQPDIG